MIQRVQTFFLVLAFLVLSVVLFFPLGKMIATTGETYRFLFYGVVNGSNDTVVKFLPLAILLVFMPLFSLVIIFFFKYRILQMRFCIYNIILMFASVGFIWFESHQAAKLLQAETFFSPSVVAPLVSAILTYFAFRGIRRDELLVRSVDRIR